MNPMYIQRIKVFLQLFAVGHIGLGLLLPYLVNTPLFENYNINLYRVLGFETITPHPQINFLLGLFGPTIASWGVLFLCVANNAFSNPDKKNWWYMLLACLAWAPYDSYLSIMQGIYINALINLVSALCILIPLFMVKGYFFRQKEITSGINAKQIGS
jgi:hypothetical protein